MRVPPDSVVQPTQVVNTNTAAGGDAVVSISAVSDEFHVLDMVWFSYDAAPTNGSLEIVADGTKFFVDITDAGPGVINFPERGFFVAKNTAVTVTLKDGNVGKQLGVQHR